MLFDHETDGRPAVRTFSGFAEAWCFAVLLLLALIVANLFSGSWKGVGRGDAGVTGRRTQGSIGGVNIRLVLRRSADASWPDPTGLAGRAAGCAAPVFHRAVVRDVLRPGRRAGRAGAAPHRVRHAARRGPGPAWP